MRLVRSRSARWEVVLLAVVFGVAAALRLGFVFDQPCLDEIWSYRLAMQATSPSQILTANAFHIDNNHWLNTLYVYVLGRREHWYPYRLLAFVGGTAMVWATWRVARPWGRWTGGTAAGLAAVSFIFVEYSSEARGYGPVVFCAVAALLALRRFVIGRSTAAVVAFGVACVLGFLAHASFVYAFAGACAYAPAALFRRGRRNERLLRDLAVLFAAPLLFFAWLYVVAIQNMRIGGGPHVAYAQVLAETFAYTVGLPTGVVGGWIVLAIVVAVTGYGAFALFRRGRDEWVFLLVGGLVAPLVLVAVRQPAVMAPRYLFAALPFTLLLAAAGLGDVARRGRAGRMIAVLLIAAFTLGNGVHLWKFYRIGRAQNRQMLTYLIGRTPGPDITYAALQLFRSDTITRYYAEHTPMRGKTLNYVLQSASTPPEWYLIDRYDQGSLPPMIRIGVWPGNYRVQATFLHYGLSGADWVVYRRDVTGVP